MLGDIAAFAIENEATLTLMQLTSYIDLYQQYLEHEAIRPAVAFSAFVRDETLLANAARNRRCGDGVPIEVHAFESSG